MTEQATAAKRSMRRRREGVVLSARGEKTIKVKMSTLTKHRKYEKYIRRRTSVLAHDEKNEAAVGDDVEIMECRPISKRKSWRLVRVVRRFGASGGASAS